MQNLFILFVIISVMMRVETSPVVRLCGRKLVNAMKALCNHRYMAPDTPFASQHHLQRSKQGIAEHCCSRPCSYSYLKTFCDEEELTTTTTTESYVNEIEDVDLVETLKRKLGKDYSQSHNGPVKTFRSLFHLLTYISQIWTEKEQFKNGTSVQTPSTE